MLRVIFACVHNAGRSQMAAAFFNYLADPARAEAISAGTEPGERVHPEVLAVMNEVILKMLSPASGTTTRPLRDVQLPRSAEVFVGINIQISVRQRDSACVLDKIARSQIAA